jgi:hypothetical protein
MVKKNLPLSLDVKATIWNEIFQRNQFLQRDLDALREECSKDPGWDRLHQWNRRFAEASRQLLFQTYGFEPPFPICILEITENRPQIIFRPDGSAGGMTFPEPPPTRTLQIDLRYTKEACCIE